MYRLALWAQRQAHRVPPRLRRMAGGVFRRVAKVGAVRSAPGEDWAVPLVPGPETCDVEALPSNPGESAAVDLPAASASAAVTRSQAAVPGPARAGGPVRCVIATGILDVGGAEEVLSFLARGLPRQGIETTVVYAATHLPGQQGRGGRIAQVLRDSGIETVELRPETAGLWLARRAPDVVSAHYAPLWLFEAAVQHGIPWTETLHGMHSFLHLESRALERERSPRIAAQVAVSELVRRQYLAINPDYPVEQIVTIPNGVERTTRRLVDRELARKALGLTDEFLFASLARYCLQKNTYGLVSAFGAAAQRFPDAHLLVAGRADDQLYYEQTSRHAEGLAVSDRIHLRGHCANPAALLAAADAFVLDSFFEGWALSSMEALISGLPVVLSDVGGAREQIGGFCERGYLVPNPAGDVAMVDWQMISELRFRSQPNREALVAAMSRVVEERQQWCAGRDGRRSVAEALFPAEDCLRGHAEVLRQVAAGGKLDAAGTRQQLETNV